MKPHQQNLLNALHGSDGVYAATAMNGDHVKGPWVARATHGLNNYAPSITAAVNRVIDKALLDTAHMQGQLEPDDVHQFMAVLQKRITNESIRRATNDAVRAIVRLLTNVSNQVFVAASVNLIDGLNNQLRDEGWGDTPIVFEVTDDDKVTPSMLTLAGVRASDYVTLMFQQVYSSAGIIRMLTQLRIATPDFNAFRRQVHTKLSNILSAVMRDLTLAAHTVEQEAVLRATEQFEHLEVRVVEDDFDSGSAD